MPILSRCLQLLAMTVLIVLVGETSVFASPAMPAYFGPSIAPQQSRPYVLQMRPGMAPYQRFLPRPAYTPPPPYSQGQAYRSRLNRGWPIPTHYRRPPMPSSYRPWARPAGGYANVPGPVPPHPSMVAWQRPQVYPGSYPSRWSPQAVAQRHFPGMGRQIHPGYWPRQHRPSINSAWPIPTYYRPRLAPPAFRAWPQYGSQRPMPYTARHPSWRPQFPAFTGGVYRPTAQSYSYRRPMPVYPQARYGYPPVSLNGPALPNGAHSLTSGGPLPQQANPYGFRPLQRMQRYQPNWQQTGRSAPQFRPYQVGPSVPRYGMHPMNRAPQQLNRSTPAIRNVQPASPPVPVWAQRGMPPSPNSLPMNQKMRHYGWVGNTSLFRPRRPMWQQQAWRSGHPGLRINPGSPQFAYAPSPLQ